MAKIPANVVANARACERGLSAARREGKEARNKAIDDFLRTPGMADLVDEIRLRLIKEKLPKYYWGVLMEQRMAARLAIYLLARPALMETIWPSKETK